MCSNTIFRSLVHLKCADLNFKWLSVRADQRRMQRLIHIWLRHGNIVLEPARNRFIHLMDDAKCRIAVFDSIYQDTYCKQIINLIDRLVLVDHLFIDTEEMFDSSVNLRFNGCFIHMLLDLFDDIVYKLLSFTFTKSNFIHQIIVYIWFQIFQRKVIQLYFDFGDTKSHSDRCINIHRFTGFFLLFLRSHILQGAHIMQAVCKLDQNNTDILCHGKKHLSKVFCLKFYFIS